MGARVEPGEAVSQGEHLQPTGREEVLVHGGDLIFATLAGLYRASHLDHIVRVEVEPDDSVVALRLPRLLLDGEAVAVGVKFGHAISLRVVHPIAEDGGLALLVGCAHGLVEHRREAVSLEDVVAQHQADIVAPDEVGPDGEGLSQSVGAGLLGIAETDAEIAAVAQQAAEAWQVGRRGDDQDVADACLHQHADGIVDHRLVIDGHQLLADSLRDGIEAGAAASC